MATAKLSKSYHNAGNKSPIMHTAPELLDIRGTLHPEKEALVIRAIGKPRQAITFGELKTRTEELAAGMIRRGLRKGDCVGLLWSTSLDYAICEYALARTGAILMRFHVRVRTGDDIKYMLKKGNCRWLIAHPGDSDETYNILCSVIPGIGAHDPAENLVSRDFPDLETVFMISAATFPGTIPWTVLFSKIEDTDFDLVRARQATISPDDIQGCYATSGSTGLPKLVAERHSFCMNHIRSLLEDGGVNRTDCLLLDRPMQYVGGHSGHICSIGLTMVYVVADVKEKAGKELFFNVIEEENCTAILLFPYLLHDFIKRVDMGRLDVSRIKFSRIGGEVVKRTLYEQILERMPNVVIGYGTTESGAGLGGSLLDSFEQRLTYTGIGHDGELKVVDDHGTIVPINTPGELCVRNQYMFVGYWGDEERTRQQKDELGWYKTDDMAVMNEDGYVTILGRRQTVISKATMKIYPLSIEKEVIKHAFVADALAVGIPHEVLYEEICICVVPKPNVSLTVDMIQQHCQEWFMVGDIGEGLMPDHILIFEAFSTGSTDKIDRKKTREKAIARLNIRQDAMA